MNALWYEAAVVATMSYAEGKCRKWASQTADEQANKGDSVAADAFREFRLPLGNRTRVPIAAVNIAEKPATEK